MLCIHGHGTFVYSRSVAVATSRTSSYFSSAKRAMHMTMGPDPELEYVYVCTLTLLNSNDVATILINYLRTATTVVVSQ